MVTSKDCVKFMFDFLVWARPLFLPIYIKYDAYNFTGTELHTTTLLFKVVLVQGSNIRWRRVGKVRYLLIGRKFSPVITTH